MKRQKIILSIMLSILCIPSISYLCLGQEIENTDNTETETSTTETSTTKVLDHELTRTDVAMLLKNIEMSFCNDGLDNPTKSLNMTISEGTPTKTCLLFTNNSDYDVTINLDLSDSILDQNGEYSCGATQGFRNNVTNADELSQLTIPAHNYLVKEADILYPIGSNKNQAGCFAFWIEGEQNIKGNGNGGVSITPISRKGYKAVFYVGNLDDIKNELKIKNIQTSKNEGGDIIIKFDVENIGNLENNLQVQGSISNILGFKRTFTSEANGIQDHVVAGKSTSVEIVAGTIPSYGGLFNIDLEVTGTPSFSFNISDDFDKTLLEPINYKATSKYFEMPWLMIIIGIFIIVILILLFRRQKPKQNVVYVQVPQQPQQPTGYQQPQAPTQQYPQQPIQQ